MNRYDVDPVSPKRLERGLQLILLDREIAIDDGVVIASSKRGPGIHSDVITDLEIMHLRFVADAEAIYSYEGTREMNTLIVGRAITGFSAFV